MKRIPDKKGYFGAYGGRFVPETLVNALFEVEEAYAAFRKDTAMKAELARLLSDYAGRPTPLYHAGRLSESLGAGIYLKREDLLHTGSHKLNNTLGQIMLARFMGKKRVIAETGAGQHGVATATVAALFNMECAVYMGGEDVERQAPNVKRMQLLGAEVIPVEDGSRTLKDAINAALRDWTASARRTHFLFGSVMGPHPFPMIVRDFQSVIGRESRAQIRKIANGDPDFVIACVGGGSNSMGIFSGFLGDAKTKLIGVEAGGRSSGYGDHCATLSRGTPGILHGFRSYILQNDEGQIAPAHSISAGLDYPGVGPEHGYLKDAGLVEYATCSDTDALEACIALSRAEGILPALESSHALGYCMKNAERFKGKKLIINLSGRGDKDLGIILKEASI